MTTGKSDQPEPSRDNVQKVLGDLASGTLSPRKASDWATPWINGKAGDVEDDVVRAALDWLSGADMETELGKYLYGQEDFRAWLTNFQSKTVR